MANVYKAKQAANPPVGANVDFYDLYTEQLLEAVDESGEHEVLVYHSTWERESLVQQQLNFQVQIEDLQERINAIDDYIAAHP